MMAGMGGMGRGTPGAKSTGREYYGSARGFHMMPPRILDIALWNGLKPGVEAAQRVPAGLRLGEQIALVTRHSRQGGRAQGRTRWTGQPGGTRRL
jgi:hypothetical protein